MSICSHGRSCQAGRGTPNRGLDRNGQSERSGFLSPFINAQATVQPSGIRRNDGHG